MVRIRLARFGSKKRPYYHMVVTDSHSPRDGRFIEQLGTYDPRKPMGEARIDRDRLTYWTGIGARPSVSVTKVVREHKKAWEAREGAAN